MHIITMVPYLNEGIQMFGIGKVEELVVVLVIILVLFGGKKLPELSRGLSESIKEVRKGFRDDPPKSTRADGPETNDKQES
jgi:sec-independent protein translocase protein TatA